MMRQNLLNSATRFHDDQSLLLVGLGGFGRSVLHLLRQEFDRLRVPDDRVFYLAIDAEPALQDAGDASQDADIVLPLQKFQADAYLAARENESLREAMAHLPETAWTTAAASAGTALPARCLPGAGFVAFHRYDETLITNRMRALVDEARAKNPSGKIKCVVVCSMAGATGAGMVVPFLFRVRDHLREKKARLEVFLATSEGHAATAGIAIEDIERNCAANAMLWEQVLLGEREFVYPGKDGVREDKPFRGPLQHRTWIFSGGLGATTYQHPVVASIIASCISTLELTRLGAYLDGDRVNYAEDILERTWADEGGGKHPTSLLAMNVAGLRADCFPPLFHLRATRAFIDEVSRSLSVQSELQLRAVVDACLRDARLADDAIVEDLGVGARPVTREEVAAAKLPQDKLHAWLSDRLEEDVGRLVAVANGQHEPPRTDVLLDRARLAINVRASTIANGPEGYLPGAILFYQVLQKHLETARQSVQHRAELARNELGMSPNRDRLNLLLDRLRRDTVPDEGGRFGVVERFVATLTVSVPTQVRKILEVAAEIRGHAQVLAAGTVLAHVYERLAYHCEKQREELQGRLYQLNTVASVCMREEELIQRSTRAAFTYQRARFEPLVEHLWTVLRDRVALPGPAEVIERVGGDLPSFLGTEPQILERLLEAVQVDGKALSEAADEVLAHDPMVRDVLKESLAQFFPTIQVDRDGFPTLDTMRARFVLCTRTQYEARRDDVFEGYHHLETDNPFNVLLTEHEEGLPFAALSYVARTHEHYKRLVEEGRAALGHSTAELFATLPPLDA